MTTQPTAINRSGNIMTVSRQWASRPDDERFLTLDDLHASVKARTDKAMPLPWNSRQTRVMPTEDNGLLMQLPEDNFNLTAWSFGQLCQRAKVPTAYAKTLPSELACINLQWGIEHQPKNEGLMLAHLSDLDSTSTARAITSSTYGRIWDIDVVEAVQKFNDKSGGRWQVPANSQGVNTKRATTLYASDRDCFMFLVEPDRTIEVDGDVLHRGFYVWNSEVGASTFGLAMFLYRRVCDNRIIWGASHYQELKIRHTSGGPERFLREATPTLQKYALESAKETEATLKRAKALQVGKDDDSVAGWLSQRGFTKAMAKTIVTTAKAEEGEARSLYDIVNGITAHARSYSNTDTRVDLERRAGGLLKQVQ